MRGLEVRATVADFNSREMAARGRIGALVTNGRHDGREITAKARATFRASFEAQADPDGILSAEERARRGEFLRRAHYQRLALASAHARRRTPEPPDPSTPSAA